MDPQLQQALAEWLTALLNQAEKAGDFALAQAPLIVQEKILYGRVSATGAFGLLLIATGVAAMMAIRSEPRTSANDSERKFGWTVFTVLLLVPLAVAAEQAVLVWCAPRVYILQWLQSLIAG